MENVKVFLSGLCVGLCVGMCLVMLWLHRSMIAAAVKGKPMPEAPEGCPAFRKK